MIENGIIEQFYYGHDRSSLCIFLAGYRSLEGRRWALISKDDICPSEWKHVQLSKSTQ
jgi:hypothetical protein